MIKKLAHVLFLTACSLAGANEIYTCEKNGSKVYQNWPCNEQPATEKPKHDYKEIVECSIKDSFDRITYELVTGKKKKIKNCTP